MYRERLLDEFYSPNFKDLPPAAFPRHRHYVADRFNFFTVGYNTNLVKPDEVPRSYEELVLPKWAGRVGMEASDVDWFVEEADDELELQQAGLPDDGLGPIDVLDAGKLDEDAVTALSGDGRLGHAELVHAVSQALEHLRHGVFLHLGHEAGTHGEREAPRRLVLVADLEVLKLGGHRQRVVPRLRRRQLDRHGARPLDGGAPDGHASTIQRRLEVLGGALGLGGQGLVGVDPQHEMNAALQVEAEIDPFLRRVEKSEGRERDDDDQADPEPQTSRHPSRS